MLSHIKLLLLFCVAILIYRNSSLIALNLEQKGNDNSLAYVFTCGGVFGSLLLGVEALYRLVRRAEKTEEYLNDRKK